MDNLDGNPPSGDGFLPGHISELKRLLTDCEQQRTAARSAEHRFRLFAEAAEDYAFISFDLDSRVTGWSRGAQRILGYDEASILGLPGSLFFTPEDRAQGMDRRETSLARTEGRAEDERWHMRQDGSRFWGSGVMTPLRDGDGEIHGYAKVMRDLTAQREAELRLQQSEERLRLFVENVLDYALIPVDAVGNVAGWNVGAERTFGYSDVEIIGQPVSRFFTPEDNVISIPEQDFHQALTDGRSEWERYMVRKDGTRFWSRWVTTPMRDEQGQLHGFAKVLRDETERKQEQETRERAAESERALLAAQIQSTGQELGRTREELQALAASLLVAQEEERRRIARELHDGFQQRLAMVEVAVTRLLEKIPKDLEPVRVELARLENELSEIAEEIRRLSRQLHPAILEDMGLSVALARLAEDFQANRAASVRFEAENVPDEIPGKVRTVLYRIAQEALRNVSKHAGAGPVTMTLTGQADSLGLTIQDDGPGFTPSEVRFKGGLGLISMQERATLAGGTCVLTSQIGRGTTVEARVPITTAGE